MSIIPAPLAYGWQTASLPPKKDCGASYAKSMTYFGATVSPILAQDEEDEEKEDDDTLLGEDEDEDEELENIDNNEEE